MARVVRHEMNGPIKLEPQVKAVWVCGCGLSKTFPICDGTHKTTCVNEAPGMVYVYDPVTSAVVEARRDLSDAPPCGDAQGSAT